MANFTTVAILFPPANSVTAGDSLLPPSDYIHSKLQQNDIVFLGTAYKEPEILSFTDVYMKTGDGLDDINLNTQIDSPEYRHLFQVFRKSGSPIPLCIDLPKSMHNGNVSSDEWMARSLLIGLNKMRSVGQMIDGNPNECDFTRKFSSLPGAVALDLDDRYRGWQMGFTAAIAVVPAECFELVDGLIVY
ncbi:MAG: hypothetical protein KFF68_05065 [Desulfosarcina sp.]|nr:hypothetical protein [Desulfosarcina sp.]